MTRPSGPLTRPSTEQSRLITMSLVVVAAVASAFALYFTRGVMVPFVLAIFLSYLVSPVIDLLQDKARVPRALGIIFALLVGMGLFTLLALLVTTSTRGLLASADIYQNRVADIAQRVFALFDRFGVDLGQRPIVEGIRELPVMNIVRRTAGTVFGIITTGGLVLIFLVYLLAARRSPELQIGIYAEIDDKIKRYLVMKFIISAVTGTVVGTILWLFGLDLALVFGVMAFLLNFIPSIGSIISTLLPIPLALIQFESTWPIVGVILFPGIIQFTIGNVVEPLVMGEGLDLHPVTILLSLIFWGLLWGFVGMLLAAPITAVLRIGLARIETTRAFGELLAGRLPTPEPAQPTG